MTRSKLNSCFLCTLTTLSLLALGAALLVAFYGFGGGHGRHDVAIALLCLPGSIVLPFIPEILLSHSDLFNVVVIPWLLNLVFALTLYLAARPLATEELTARHNPSV